MSAQPQEGSDVDAHNPPRDGTAWDGRSAWDSQDFGEIDGKLDLARFSYTEVLDATKHQDDKIGRMFMSVAFLTAATLALAGLASAEFITRTFHVAPFELPLGLIALAVFLICMLFSVLQLLVSFATPLRVPGIEQVGHDWKVDRWVNNVKASQIYFYSISGVDSHEWMKKWTASTEELKKERLELLVRETHNLGVRTTFKYDRGAEAVSALSFALLAFGIAIIFVAIAAGSPGDSPIELNMAHRLVTGLMLGGYCALQLLARVRYVRQALDEARPPELGGGPRRRVLAERWFVPLFAFLVGAVVVYDHSWPPYPVWVAIVMVLGAASFGSYVAASGGPKTPREAANRSTRLATWWAEQWNRVSVCLMIVAMVVTALYFGCLGLYAFQLLVAVVAISLLVGTSLIEPTLTMHRRRQKYLKRLASAPVIRPRAAEE